MWQSLHDAWWRLATQSQPHSFTDALAVSALQTGSWVYRAAVSLRNAAYDRGCLRPVRLPCRVVSVGNLTVGGTGKTACVELITRKLTTAGRRPAVLSRGYGGRRATYWLRSDGATLLVNGEPPAALDGLADEPQLLARHLPEIPVLVGARRDQTGRPAWGAFGVDTVVLDDGFQHRRLARDCNIVLLHARTPFGGWHLLPRGPMREPMSALRRADVIIITKADEALEQLAALTERLRAVAPEADVLTAAHEPAALTDGTTGQALGLGRLDGARVALVSSIGDPVGFEATVKRLHASALWHHTLPDHHRYRPADWAALLERCRGLKPDALVTTEKDWVRLQPVFAPVGGSLPVWVLGIRMKLLTGDALLDARLARLHAR